ncbi:hypothetical protein AgCh_015785 [Apium graveolens]
MDDDEPTIRAIKKSFQAGANVHSDVLYFYVRHLEKTMSSLGALKISVQDTYSYIKSEDQFKMARDPTLANKFNFNQHSYILFPIHKERGSKLKSVRAPFGFLQLSLEFLKRLWANTNKPFSQIPNVITRQVEFTENWFDPKDAFALREDIWPIMCEELESHFGRPISRKLHDDIQNLPLRQSPV